jgi:hypothetical protein
VARKVAAVMKYGDAAARASLCQEVWDAQVCKSWAVSGSEAPQEPADVRQLVLPAAGLAVVHLGLLASLTRLDLSVPFRRHTML